MANNPELLKMPLARDGQKSTIPETTDGSTGLFSQQYGWQSINSLPPQAGGKAVKREDFNGAFNLLGGIAFMAQKGFTFKWSADQDYYAGCVVIDDTDGLRYECIADVTANSTAPSADATHWQIFSAGTDLDAWFRQASTVYAVGDMRCYESLPYGWYLECTTAGTTGSSDITIPSPLDIGDTVTDGTVTWTIRKIGNGDGFAVGDIIMIAGNNTIRDGWLECDGRAVSRTMFPDLFSAIGTTYGAGDGSTTFNLPSLDYIIGVSTQLNGTAPVTLTNANNINYSIGGASDGTACWYNTQTGTLTNVGGYSTSTKFPKLLADLTDADIQSDNLYSQNIRYVIKAYDGVTPTPAEADISQMLTELTGKADRDLDNLSATGEARFAHVVVGSYYDDTTGDWWREYADGWVEQGGIKTTNGEEIVNLLKPMADMNYSISGAIAALAGGAAIAIGAASIAAAMSTTTIKMWKEYDGNKYWQVCGMGAQS